MLTKGQSWWYYRFRNTNRRCEDSRLRGKIREVFGTEASFAKALGMGRVSLSQRLNNALEFSATEIRESCLLLGISSEDIPAYFFAEKVQKHERDAE